jgi:hypothetical protein
MRKWQLWLTAIVCLFILQGCSSREDDSAPPPKAPINNSAPEARNAPSAPIDPRSDPRGGKGK